MTPEDRENLLKFVRDIVSELFGEIPATEPDAPEDVIGTIALQAGAQAPASQAQIKWSVSLTTGICPEEPDIDPLPQIPQNIMHTGAVSVQ